MADNGKTGGAAPLEKETRKSPLDRLMSNRRSQIAFFLLALIALAAACADFVAPHGYSDQNRENSNGWVSGSYPLGTDFLGRCQLTRIMYGARVSLLAGVFATLLSLFIGVLAGLIAGFVGGFVDTVIMRIVDTVSAFPSLILAIAITALYKDKPSDASLPIFLTPSFVIMFLALGVVGWTGVARLVRSQVLSLKTLDYVSAAQALGAGPTRIMLRHILPNCVSPVIVIGSLMIGGNILGEAGLSFLGLGVQDPYPSWGKMLSQAQSTFQNYWWQAVFPGLAIVCTVLAFNLLGDGLRDALDPKSGHEK